MTTPVKIDFVSDVVCPWCAIGLSALEQAIRNIGPELQVELAFRPFELNPQMAKEGEDVGEHLARKYGLPEAQLKQNEAAIRSRGEELGFAFDMTRRRRIHNTFDAHRLLHWAGLQSADAQRELKHALLRAYFTEGRDISDAGTLVPIAQAAGLDGDRVRQVLGTGEYADAVRAQESFYRERGIQAVPSVIFNDRHLVQGGQPVETFERALRQLSGLAESKPDVS